MKSVEVNFDGLIGPTHHYGGLSFGNIASEHHQFQTSSPRQAALEGLAKMKLLHELGVPQAVFPPQFRPDILYLKSKGFNGSNQQILQKAFLKRPDLLSIASSASSMWAANAATISPSADTTDGKVHFTPANLASTEHRALEPEFTTRLLKKIFFDSSKFTVHSPLPDTLQRQQIRNQSSNLPPQKRSLDEENDDLHESRKYECDLADEGAANHLRIGNSHSSPAMEVFVYGRSSNVSGPAKFPARQTLEACHEIIQRHKLRPEFSLTVQQSPEVIDSGVFHNDVISVANENLLVCHEKAFVQQERFLESITEKNPKLEIFQVSERELPVEVAVKTYLFNSQIVTLPEGQMLFLAPRECQENPIALAVLERLQSEITSIKEVKFIDVRQSMQNGGGPACLRLRVVLSEAELENIHPGILLTDKKYQLLCNWVDRHYRDEFTLETLAVPEILNELYTAFDELTQLLELDSLYEFQQ